MHEYLKLSLAFVLAGFMITGCGSSKLKYVVYRDIPQQPAFTVVPVSYSAADYRFKENTESSLVEMGLSVIEAPLLRRADTERKSNVLRTQRDIRFSDAEKHTSIDDLVETSMMYDQAKADYVILVNAETSVLKITKRDTHEIQALIKYTVLDKSGSRFIKLQETLLSLGFNVKAVSKQEKLKMEYPLKEKSLMRH